MALGLALLVPAVARGRGYDHLARFLCRNRAVGFGETNARKVKKITRPGGRKDR